MKGALAFITLVTTNPTEYSHIKYPQRVKQLRRFLQINYFNYTFVDKVYFSFPFNFLLYMKK